MQNDVYVTPSKGTVETIVNENSSFYSRIFLVEKASSRWRPIISLSPLNAFVQLTEFKTETNICPSFHQERGHHVFIGNEGVLPDPRPLRIETIPSLHPQGDYLSIQGKVGYYFSNTVGLRIIFSLVSTWSPKQNVCIFCHLDSWLVCWNTMYFASMQIPEVRGKGDLKVVREKAHEV